MKVNYELIFATSNENKVKEVNQLLPKTIRAISLKELGFYDEIPETKDTIEGNAKQKASYIFHEQHEDVFAEDTGLEVTALNGAPGVRSARYAGEHKNADDNMQLLLSQLANKEDRTARFKTVIALYLKGKYYEFEGILEGKITDQKKGNSGFGYDPIFQPNEFNKTLAQLTAEEKNKISHRGIAVRKLIRFLENELT